MANNVRLAKTTVIKVCVIAREHFALMVAQWTCVHALANVHTQHSRADIVKTLFVQKKTHHFAHTLCSKTNAGCIQ